MKLSQKIAQVNFLSWVCYRYNGTIYDVILALNIMNRFLVKATIHPKEQGILGIVSLWLCYKLDDIEEYLTMEDMLKVCKNKNYTYHEEDILSLERRICDILEFNLYTEQIFYFITQYAFNIHLIKSSLVYNNIINMLSLELLYCKSGQYTYTSSCIRELLIDKNVLLDDEKDNDTLIKTKLDAIARIARSKQHISQLISLSTKLR